MKYSTGPGLFEHPVYLSCNITVKEKKNNRMK